MASKSKTNVARTNVDDVVLTGIIEVLRRNNRRVWSGTMTALNSALTRVLGRKRAEILPGSPGALRTVTNRVVNRLRNRRVSVRFVRTTDHARTRLVRFAR
jgi:molybdopterin biosynthesis enzyme MoaB